MGGLRMEKIKKLLNVSVFTAVAVYGIAFAVVLAVEIRLYDRPFFLTPFYWILILFPIIFLIGVYRQRNVLKKEKSKALRRVEVAFSCLIYVGVFAVYYYIYFQNGDFKTDVAPWQVLAVMTAAAIAEVLRKKRSWGIGVKHAANVITVVSSAMLTATVLFLLIA